MAWLQSVISNLVSAIALYIMHKHRTEQYLIYWAWYCLVDAVYLILSYEIGYTALCQWVIGCVAMGFFVLAVQDFAMRSIPLHALVIISVLKLGGLIVLLKGGNPVAFDTVAMILVLGSVLFVIFKLPIPGYVKVVAPIAFLVWGAASHLGNLQTELLIVGAVQQVEVFTIILFYYTKSVNSLEVAHKIAVDVAREQTCLARIAEKLTAVIEIVDVVNVLMDEIGTLYAGQAYIDLGELCSLVQCDKHEYPYKLVSELKTHGVYLGDIGICREQKFSSVETSRFERIAIQASNAIYNSLLYYDLSTKEKLQRELVERSLQGVLIFKDQEIVYANDTAQQIYGGLVGKNVYDVMRAKAISIEGQGQIIPRNMDSFDISVPTESGEIWLEGRLTDLGDGKKMMFFVDITARKMIEQKQGLAIDRYSAVMEMLAHDG